jgi:N-acetylglucosamine-6-phosphate deacetylase
MTVAYKAKKIFTSKFEFENSYILVKDGLIEEIVSEEYLPKNLEIRDYSTYNIAPAFIDLQIYGGGGSLFNTEPTAETIQKTYNEISQQGTSHFQITLSTVSLETMLLAIDACKNYKKSGGKGLIGLHLEGPYFNPIKKGAHVEKYVRKPTLAEIKTLIDASQGMVTYLTLAPEICDVECLELLLDSGISLSVGHSDATFEQAKTAFRKGLTRVTHLFNAMSQFQSRAPGLVGATYDSEVRASIVADGIHVDFNAIRISKKIMAERLFYITDAVTEDTRGEYSFTLHNDHYINEKGVLAGSALSMMKAVKNGVEKVGIPLEESLRMASTYPAEVANLSHQLGKIENGHPANFVVFDDDFNVIDTVME